MLSDDMYTHENMNYVNSNNLDNSPEPEAVKTLERRQEFMQHFTPEFIEKHKHCYVFRGIMAELTKGTNPYLIIKQLVEHLSGSHREHKPF
jgi:hypothetical protein